MHITKLLLAATLSIPFFVACASSDDGTTGDDQNVTAHNGSPLHGMCGGLAGRMCAAGLECRIPDAPPGAADMAGQCEKPDVCGGIAGLPCRAGTECRMSGPTHPDQSGVCKELACPAPGRTVDCEPPATNSLCNTNRDWAVAHCSGITFAM